MRALARTQAAANKTSVKDLKPCASRMHHGNIDSDANIVTFVESSFVPFTAVNHSR